MPELDEHELIVRSQKGDATAFSLLIEAYDKRIYAIAFKFMRNDHDAQDAAQEAILKMFTNIGKFSFRSAFSTWMYRVTANTCLDLIRKRRTHEDIDEAGNYIVSTDGEPMRETLNHELGETIKRAILSLPEKYIPVIILKDVDGKKYEEIAQILGISVGTVKSRLSRGRDKLRTILMDAGIL
ncbi:MAG: sigma-70 family RNA polymerase sigma factor [Clostridia bacterium]|nr:sigma-70 family RNA polymerase sigma factor [Clostridia bacterium]